MEDIINHINGKVQVIFERTSISGPSAGLRYRDTLWFTPEQYNALTREEIIALQDIRFNNWKEVVDAMPWEDTSASAVDTPVLAQVS